MLPNSNLDTLQVVSHHHFLEALQECKAKLMAELNSAGLTDRKEPIRIGFRCKRGRHRSVAMLCVVSSILEEWPVTASLRIGYSTPHTEVCGCPDDCTNLQAPIKRLKAMVDSTSRESIAAEWLQDGQAAVNFAKRLWLHSG